ncbi:MAG TPA: low affinity iron permease family protein [Xanthomonadaceae bacterium]|jgi:low affinity Fe/Cu permease|nr:low affinity iron permease family protein [Xanthomonadaceae bacterium]
MANGKWFGRIAKGVSRFTGSAVCFGLALGAVAVWAATGPMFKYSDNWQLVINTGTTIITFLMVFLIQNSQNRDTEAIHIKLDELIRATHGAQNALLDLEDLEPEELAKFRASYTRLAGRAKDEADPAVSEAGIHHVELDGIPQTHSKTLAAGDEQAAAG